MHDLVVIGGGPAGSSAARRAAELGLQVLLVEKEQFPRFKACGGALSARAESFLGFDVPAWIRERDIYGARVHYKGQVAEAHSHYRVATLVTRSVFDSFLLDKAVEVGVSLDMGSAVMKLEERSEFVQVHTERGQILARFVIVAEGAQGILQRVVQGAERPARYACLMTEIPVSEDESDRPMDIYFGVAPRGYGWLFPHRDYVSVGVGGLATRHQGLREVMSAFLQANGFCGEYKLRGHIVPVGGVKRSLHSQRVLLAGDAAGFVDAFLGEGIAYAIRSGQIAAAVVGQSLAAKSLEVIREYPKQCAAGFGDDLRQALLLAELVHRFPDLFLGLLSSNASVVGRYLDVPGAKLTYTEYLRWLLSQGLS